MRFPVQLHVLYARCRHHNTSVAERVSADRRRNGAFYIDGRAACRSVIGHTAVVQITGQYFMLLTVILIIISFPSPTHSFTPGLNLPFLQILPAAAFLFLLQD